MKLKVLFTALLIAFTMGAFAQNTVDVFINGTKSGQYSVKEGQTDGGGIWYKKKVYRDMDRLSFQVKGRAIRPGFIRTLEVTDDHDKSLLIAQETTGVDGQFAIMDRSIMKRLGKGKPIKLYLLLTPGNTKSKEANKRVYVGMLYTK